MVHIFRTHLEQRRSHFSPARRQRGKTTVRLYIRQFDVLRCRCRCHCCCFQCYPALCLSIYFEGPIESMRVLSDEKGWRIRETARKNAKRWPRRSSTVVARAVRSQIPRERSISESNGSLTIRLLSGSFRPGPSRCVGVRSERRSAEAHAASRKSSRHRRMQLC